MLGETYGENLGEISPRFIWIYMFVLKEKKGGLSLPAPKAPKKIMAGGAHPFLSGWQFSASISFRGSKCPNAARYLLVDVGSCCSPMCCTKQHGEKTAPKKRICEIRRAKKFWFATMCFQSYLLRPC